MTDDHSSVEAVAKAIKAVWDAEMQQAADASGGMMEYEPGPWQEWELEARAAIAAMSDHSGTDAARETIRDALLDSHYLAGAKAGWNAALNDNPEAAFAALQRSRDGHLSGYKEAKATLANAALTDQDKLVGELESLAAEKIASCESALSAGGKGYDVGYAAGLNRAASMLSQALTRTRAITASQINLGESYAVDPTGEA